MIYNVTLITTLIIIMIKKIMIYYYYYVLQNPRDNALKASHSIEEMTRVDIFHFIYIIPRWSIIS